MTYAGHDIDAGLEDTLEDAVTDMVDRLVDGLEKATGARPRDAGRVAAALEDTIAACRRDPRVGEQLDLACQLDEVAETYSELGRVEDAIETMHAAIAAGFHSTPDPRGRLAQIQLRAGRAEPAHDLYAAVYADTPDDVWLHNNGRPRRSRSRRVAGTDPDWCSGKVGFSGNSYLAISGSHGRLRVSMGHRPPDQGTAGRAGPGRRGPRRQADRPISVQRPRATPPGPLALGVFSESERARADLHDLDQ